MKPLTSVAFLLALVGVCGLGCKTNHVVSESQAEPQATLAKPSMVYVADFDLWAERIQHQDGMLAGRQGPLGMVGGKLSGNTADPAARARQIVDLMANSLVKELRKAGFAATRLPPGAAYANDGWLLRGVFTQVDEGNRLRRAMIGFGQGETDLQVLADVQDLSKGSPKPLYVVTTEAASGSSPGAAPTLVLGPYGAAARFVMAGKDLEKNVKQTAVEIASRLTKHVQTSK